MEQTNGSGQFLSFHDVLKRFIFLVHAFVNETWVRIWVNIRFSDFVSLELDTEIKQKKKMRTIPECLIIRLKSSALNFWFPSLLTLVLSSFFLSQNLH